jgi:hypothetical protein
MEYGKVGYCGLPLINLSTSYIPSVLDSYFQ